MNQDRRKFIKLTGGATAAYALSTMTGISLLSTCNGGDKIKSFGLQLWTLRDSIGKDPKGILQQVASYGYSHVESFEGQQGIFWGMKNTEFKKHITDLGMTMHSAHFGSDKDFEKKAAEAGEIGMKYLTLAWEGPGKTIEDYKKMAADFNKKGEVCKKNGIRFAFHNHDFTFRKMEGQFAQDVLMNNTDSSLVDYEMDIYWVVAAGEDPEAWFKKYPNRFRLSHVKDIAKNPGTDNGKNSVDLGTGSINWPSVLKTAKANGMEYFIVEQEAYPNGTPIQAIQTNAEYMKKLRL